MSKPVTTPSILYGMRQAAFLPFTNMENMLSGWFRSNVNVNVFGRNVEDRDVEADVLNRVGSYGKQLNTILDALVVLINKLEQEPAAPSLSQPEHHAIYELKLLAKAADTAARQAQGLAFAADGTADKTIVDG